MLCFITWCFLLLGYSQCQNVSELCGEINRLYLPFTRPNERIITNEESGLSDTFIREGWYGTKGFIIPDSPPGNSKCGTSYPIYLKEGTSRSGDIEDVTACVQASEPCEIELEIKALVCSPSLTLYRLLRAPLDNSAYCLAATGGDDFPDFQTRPYVRYNLITVDSGKSEYEFTCDFYNPRNDTLLFKTEWFVDSVSVFESNFSEYEDNDTIRALTDTKLKTAGITTVGFQLNCEVRAAFRSKLVAGLPSKSKQKFIGIEVQNAVISVKEGNDATISIRPSMEIGCETGKDKCTLSVTAILASTTGCLPTVGVNGGCGVQISTDAWNGWQYSWTSLKITTSATRDYGRRTVTKEINLQTNLNYLPQKLWQNYALPPIKVIISKDTKSIEGRACKFTNDPYLRDFKNRMLRFELSGVFIFFKTDNVEIQVQVYPCDVYSSGYCVCGVIIRVGRTAFMINHCNYDYWFIDYILCDNGGDVLDVKKKSESRFEVFLPSGTKAVFIMYGYSKYHWMAIEITPSIIDFGKTSGLCNTLSNNGVKEFGSDLWWWGTRETLGTDEAFFNEWKLEKNDNSNLFIPKNLQSVQQWEPLGTFQSCKCLDIKTDAIDKELECSVLPKAEDCVVDANYTLFHKKRCISPLRKKRSIPTFMSIDVHRRQKRDVSWKNGWTAERADEYCTNLFNNSKSIERCNGIKGLDIGGAVQSCITDIQLSGTDVFALASISAVSSHCLNEAKMNRTLRQEKVEEGKSILELVKEVSCPGECSDQGRCEKGKCICNSGYIGSDCSLSLNEPPLAANLEADGYCDLLEDDCNEVAVFGGRFVDHGETKCKLYSFEIKDKVVVSDEVVVKTAIFESIGEVTCKLPSRKRKRSVDEPVIDETVTGYKVSVSNNGQNYSQQLNLIIYNTECMNCTVDSDDMKCSFSSSFCIMENRCYQSGSMYNVDDREFLCRADSNGKDWIPIIKGTVVDVTTSPSISVSELCSETNGLYLPFTKPHERLITNGDSGLSDTSMRDGWYGTKRFIIPDSPPGRSKCGTSYPIYLKEKPTSSRNIETLIACVQAYKECEIQIQIKALVCSSSLTLYRLARAPLDDSAYCLASSGGYAFPDFQTKPSINYTLITVTSVEREYEFTCDFTNPINANLVYQTEWFVDDVSVFESNFSDYEDNDKVRALTDTKLKAAGITTVGFQLNCEVRAGFRSYPVAGLPSKSKKKFIGIEVDNAVISVREGEEATISIKPSVEIGCYNEYRCTFSVIAALSPTASCLPTVGVNGNCGLQISTDRWNEWTSLNISTTVTRDYGRQTVIKEIYLQTDMLYLAHPLWKNYALPVVKVIISKDTQSIEGRACIFSNDPYLRDFKNRMLRFELAGVFILFKTDNVEIQVQVTPCYVYMSGYCICGVIIRVGRTAFMINHCNYNYWFIDYILCDNGGDVLDVKKQSETKFEVFLPSGTKVVFDIHDFYPAYHWMGIEITPSVIDFGKTSGLCNKLDNYGVLTFPWWWSSNRETLDTDEAFFNRWKLENNVNLFEPSNLLSVQQWNPVNTFQRCKCVDVNPSAIDRELDCAVLPIVDDCDIDATYTLFHKKRCISPLRKKRSIPNFLSIDVHRRQKRDASWKNGWTAERADKHCTNLFNNSKSIERCNGIKGLDIGGAVQSCITNIQLSGTDVFTLASISTVNSQCLNEAKMNRTLRQEIVEEGKSILELVKEVSCPGECSNQGRCEKGKCICNAGYIGSDCTISLNKPPLAANLEADGYCDLSEDDCNEVAVFGGRFVDHGQIKCKLYSFEIKKDKVVVSDEVVVQPAVFESIGEVTCKLPSRKRKRSVAEPVIDETVTGYKVSVSNNGQDYSQQLNLIIYDTECMNCTMDSGETKCSFSSSYCIMENRCYQSDSMYNADDREFICRADSNGKDWIPIINGTVVDVTTSPSTTDETDYVVIGISVTAVLVFIIICLIIFITWRSKCRPSRRPGVLAPTIIRAYDVKDINPNDNGP